MNLDNVVEVIHEAPLGLFQPRHLVNTVELRNSMALFLVLTALSIPWLIRRLNESEAKLYMLEITSRDHLKESTVLVEKALESVNRLKRKTSTTAAGGVGGPDVPVSGGPVSCAAGETCPAGTACDAGESMLCMPGVPPGEPTVSGPTSLILAGTDAVMTCTLAGTGFPVPGVQWLKDGGELPGATGTTLNLSPVALADIGDYSCRATNDFGSETSQTQRLSVTP